MFLYGYPNERQSRYTSYVRQMERLQELGEDVEILSYEDYDMECYEQNNDEFRDL